jgi:SAM-dependent methyltransferase
MRGRPRGVLAERPHAWLTSGDEVLVPGYICIVRPRLAPVRQPGQDDDHGCHWHHRIDRPHWTRGGTGAASRRAPRPGSRRSRERGEPVAKALELAALLERQPLRVAELGCGGGFYLDEMATAWPTAELIGYDLDPVAVALAAQRLGSNPRVRLRQVDGRRVADDGPFDLILAAPLHDVADPAGVLNAARNALAKGGVIAIAELPYPSEFLGQADPAERLGYLTSLFNCLHYQIEQSGAGAVGAVVRESDIRAWGTSAGLPSCTVYDNGGAQRMFVLGSA